LVTDASALQEITDGVLAGLHSGSVLVDMSSIDPSGVRELAQRVPAGPVEARQPLIATVHSRLMGSLLTSWFAQRVVPPITDIAQTGGARAAEA